MTIIQNHRKPLPASHAFSILALLAITGCSSAPKLPYQQANYKQIIYQVTYDMLRTVECRQSETRQAFRPCDQSYFRDFQQYQQVRSDFFKQKNQTLPIYAASQAQ